MFQIESRAQMSMLPRLKPRLSTTWSSRSRSCAPVPSRATWCIRICAAAAKRGAIDYPGPGARRRWSAPWACRSSRSRSCSSPSCRGLHAGEADNLRRAMGSWERHGGSTPFKDRLLEGMNAQHLPGGVRRSASASRCRASVNTDFRRVTRQVSHCWSMTPPGSSTTSPRRSPVRCSTASPWGFMPRRSWCGMPARMGWRCGRGAVASDWDARSSGARMASRRCGWACAW